LGVIIVQSMIVYYYYFKKFPNYLEHLYDKINIIYK